MKKSPLSTPGYNTGNFHHQNRGRRGGYGYHESRNNVNNEHFQRFSRSNNSSNSQFGNEMVPVDSSSPIFYNKRGNRRKMFDRRNQCFSNTSLSSSNDNQRNFQNNLDSPYQRVPNKFRQGHEPNWHRRLPITEFIDLKSIFENPWAELEKDNSLLQQSNTNMKTENISIETVHVKDELGDTFSDSNSEENSTDMDNSQEEQKDGSSIDLHLDGINFSCNSKDASI